MVFLVIMSFKKMMILFLQIFHGILLQMMVMMIYDYDDDDDDDDDTEVEQATHGNVMESAQERRDDDADADDGDDDDDDDDDGDDCDGDDCWW